MSRRNTGQQNGRPAGAAAGFLRLAPLNSIPEAGALMLREMRELYDYNSWATERFLGAIASLNPDEYTRDLRSSFPSVRATMAHILGAEWIWLQRWSGVSPTGFPEEWDTSTPDALRERWDEFAVDQRSFLAGLDEDSLRAIVVYHNVAGKEFASVQSHMMRHVVNHSTYHRGQVATMLRQLGRPVPVSDLIAFYRELG